MGKNSSIFLAFAILFLFMIQLAGTLVESIYILDLMNSKLDVKVLGLLFFFSPVLLFLFRNNIPSWMIWLVFSSFLISRGTIPYLNTLGRMIASGIGVGLALLLFPLLVMAKSKEATQQRLGLGASAGLSLAVSLSVLLRTIYHSLDISLTPAGGWIAWGLGLIFGWSLKQLGWNLQPEPRSSKPRVALPLLGVFLILTLVYFVFSAPAVIARWTQGNYVFIVIVVSLFSAAWVFLTIGRRGLLARFPRHILLLWNILFALSITGTILAHRFAFPATPDSPAVVIGTPSWLQQIPLMLMLLSWPVIFLDLHIFFSSLQAERPSLYQFAPGMLIGSLALVLLIFMNIFTNVWGYVSPISTPFRNQFYLPYLLITGVLTLLVWRNRPIESQPSQSTGTVSWGWSSFLGAVFLGTVLFALRTEQKQSHETNKNSLVVMTYNIQQANDEFGEKSYEQQLALIQQISPDILALQESDSARISLNNNDYVRYYAGKLGYYSYYGPNTVTGTFGTAILSRYPLQNPRAAFTFSDEDEIGTAEAEVTVDGHTFTIYNVHPDGSDTAMLVFAKNLVERARDKTNVIALGDYNLHDDEEAFRLIAAVYVNAWTSAYPANVSSDGTDMSERNPIDHIFLSPNLIVQDSHYILPPDSATDHPVHWAEVFWEE